jgi:hypothetical protein
MIPYLLLSNTKFWEGTFGASKELPSFGARSDTVMVAGFSSGAFMATNLHTIFSETFKGAALVAGGPYSIGTLCDNGCL